MVHFIDMMVSKLVEKSRNFTVVERRRIEILERELNFSLTLKVSDETIQEIGKYIGADIVIYGAFRKGISENAHRMTITATVTETGQILSQKMYAIRNDSRLPGFTKDEKARLWTLGLSLGSSFSQPLLIGTIHGTIAPFHYSFLELGVDAGFLSRKPVESYYSISPFAHYAFFWPFDKGGIYIGAGVSYWHSNTTTYIEQTVERKILADAIAGVNLIDMIDISYTLRTNFAKVTNKFSIGYTYRFN
ncbi:MAG: CsgG/HfaB family protein [Lentimicrobiaceae bacterium]|nr:CsgG/HfaB family protein [Lentimicrobiaceae bacterium]